MPHNRIRKASLWWRDISNLGNDFTKDEGWFKKVTSLKIGKGDKAMFWKDTWCGAVPFSTLFPDLYEVAGGKRIKQCNNMEWLNF